MDLARLLFSAKRRIGPPAYWSGFLILTALSVCVLFVPLAGPFLWLATFFPWTQLTTKRLHDMNLSGWVQLVAYGVNLALVIGGIALVGGAAFLTLLKPGAVQSTLDAGFAAGFGGAFLATGGVLLFNAAWLVWIGSTPGTRGENRYGAPPPYNPVRRASS